MGSGRKAEILIEGKSFREISEDCGIREATLRARYRPGCTIKDLVENTGRKTGRTTGGECRAANGLTLSEISRQTGIPYHTLYWRAKHGYDTYAALISERYELRNKGERE